MSDDLQRPVASLSLDLDNQWSYMKTHGDPGWQAFPSYLDILVPRVLAFLKRRNLTITFFVVGQDAALPQNRKALAAISAAGHEIGNHSFHHEPWLHLYSRPDLETEIANAEEAIIAATGRRPIGFRGPGYSMSQMTLTVLADRGYHYDASTLPTFIGPLARAYYFATAKLTGAQRDQRQKLFGTMADGLRPLDPYLWRLDAAQLLEIPVTTFPLFRVPIHFSYLLYLARYSEILAKAYFQAALTACRATGTEPSLLLHPLDFLGGDDVGNLSFFPAMDMSGARKMALMDSFTGTLCRKFRVVTMAEHAALAGGSTLPVLQGRLAGAAMEQAQ